MLLMVYVTVQKEQQYLKRYQKGRDFSYLVITGETDNGFHHVVRVDK